MLAFLPAASRSSAETLTTTCDAPDPNTRAPRFGMPAHAYDAHCHIFAATFPDARDRTYTPPDAPQESLAARRRHSRGLRSSPPALGTLRHRSHGPRQGGRRPGTSAVPRAA